MERNSCRTMMCFQGHTSGTPLPAWGMWIGVTNSYPLNFSALQFKYFACYWKVTVMALAEGQHNWETLRQILRCILCRHRYHQLKPPLPKECTLSKGKNIAECLPHSNPRSFHFEMETENHLEPALHLLKYLGNLVF